MDDRPAFNPSVAALPPYNAGMNVGVARAALTPGRTALTVVPSFGLHEIEPLAAGARVVKVAMTPDLGFDVLALEAALAEGPDVVFLSSPWNPVGPALDREELARLLAAWGRRACA